MAYINAFLLSGFLCVICQTLLVYTKLGVPKILILGFTVGAILSAAGPMAKLTSFGGAGMIVLIIDAGEAVYRGTIAALSGNAGAILIFLGVIAAVTVIAILAAFAYTETNVGRKAEI